MKQKRNFPWVKVSEKQERSLRRGHPWVYEDEILETGGSLEDGGIADVFSRKEKYLGSGLLSLH
jgi:23S rRNA (cytosine1962-C5)-methyltransferase